MDQSIFSIMEQNRIIDRLLFWSAIFLPVFVAGLALTLKNESIVTKNRHRWVLASLAAPGLLILWNIYNAVTDRYGLESVKALVINSIIFIIAAIIVTALRIILRALLTTPPPPPAITQQISVQKFTTTRMRSLTLNESETSDNTGTPQQVEESTSSDTSNPAESN